MADDSLQELWVPQILMGMNLPDRPMAVRGIIYCALPHARSPSDRSRVGSAGTPCAV